jgi:hypothetical protein
LPIVRCSLFVHVGSGSEVGEDGGVFVVVEVAGVFDVDAVVAGEGFEEGGEGGSADAGSAGGVFRDDGVGLRVWGVLLNLVVCTNLLRTPPMTR